MTHRVSQNGILRQLNRGDSAGEINSSLNLDLKTNPGVVRISPRLTPIVQDNDTGITGMGVPLAFVVHEKSSTKQYYAITGIGTGLNTSGTGRIFVSDDSDFTSDWDNDGTASTPTAIHLGFSDAVEWRENLYVTTYVTSVANSVMYELSSSWDTNFLNTRGATDFKTQGGIKNLCPAFNGNLYFTDDDEVDYIPPSGNAVQSGAGTLDFLGVYRPIWIRSSSNRLWIGLMTKDAGAGSKGYVAEWDGNGTAAQRIYDIDAPCALSCCILNDVPYIIDAYGILKKLGSAGFFEVARLPVANQRVEMPGIYDDINNSRWIHHRGMDVVEGKININVNNFVSTGVYITDMPSGIWEYNHENGSLHHKNAPCAASTDFGQQLISTSGAIFGSRRSSGTLLAGYGYYTDSSTERKGVFYDDVANNSNKVGNYTLSFIPSENIDDFWQRVMYRHFPLPSSDKIIGKRRTKKSSTYPLLITITWTGTTSFSTTTNLSGLTGYEVEVVQGSGASKTAHITQIVSQDGLYYVDLDETFTGVSGTAKAYIKNFKKMSSLTKDGSVEGSMNVGEKTTRVQIKSEIQATGDMEIEDITLINSGHKLLG